MGTEQGITDDLYTWLCRNRSHSEAIYWSFITNHFFSLQNIAYYTYECLQLNLCVYKYARSPFPRLV